VALDHGHDALRGGLDAAEYAGGLQCVLLVFGVDLADQVAPCGLGMLIQRLKRVHRRLAHILVFVPQEFAQRGRRGGGSLAPASQRHRRPPTHGRKRILERVDQLVDDGLVRTANVPERGRGRRADIFVPVDRRPEQRVDRLRGLVADFTQSIERTHAHGFVAVPDGLDERGSSNAPLRAEALQPERSRAANPDVLGLERDRESLGHGLPSLDLKRPHLRRSRLAARIVVAQQFAHQIVVGSERDRAPEQQNRPSHTLTT